jgi:hypothetical protein
MVITDKVICQPGKVCGDSIFERGQVKDGLEEAELAAPFLIGRRCVATVSSGARVWLGGGAETLHRILIRGGPH